MSTQPKPQPAAGLKQRDIERCAGCGRGVMHDGHPTFYRVSVQMFMAMPQNIQRAQGLEIMLGGAAALAAVLGPDEDMAQAPCPPDTGLLCMACALDSDAMPLARLHEKLSEAKP